MRGRGSVVYSVIGSGSLECDRRKGKLRTRCWRTYPRQGSPARLTLIRRRPRASCCLSGTEESRMLTLEVTGDLPEIIGNEKGLYEGDLIFYFQTLFFRSSNLHNPYHNFRHMLHVLWLCYKACLHYEKKLTPREMRNLLVAALFHDFDHPG